MASDCPVPGTPPALPGDVAGDSSFRLPMTPTYDSSIPTTHPQPSLEVPMQPLGEIASAGVTDMINFDDGRETLVPREEVE